MSVAIVAVTRIFANVIDLQKSKALLYFFAGSQKILPRPSLREKCPESELFWSAFSRIWTEYGEILCIQSECGKMRFGITPNMDTFYAVVITEKLKHFGRIKCYLQSIHLCFSTMLDFTRLIWDGIFFECAKSRI